ncbi:MAG: PEP-CTERM sorting domain-containing protein [Myxococcota bacterium]
MRWSAPRGLRLLCAIASLAAALPSGAASISISADRSNTFPGETIQITIALQAGGESAPSALLTLGYDTDIFGNARLVQGAGPLTSFGSVLWIQAALEGACDQPGQCRVLDRIAPSPIGVEVDPYASEVVFAFDALRPGLPEFNFTVDNFFGASAPSISVFVGPEPGSVGLVGLGLAALGVRGRRTATRPRTH